MNGAVREARSAAVTLVGVIISFLVSYALCAWAHAAAAPAVLAAIMTISLARRSAKSGWAHLGETLLTVALVAPAATGVALLFHIVPIAGALVFTAGMFASVWLRNFGPLARQIGALISLPLLALIIVPGRANAPGGPLVDFLLFAGAGVIAFAVAAGVGVLRGATLPSALRQAQDDRGARGDKGDEAKPGLSVATRMAWQMAAALGLAFVVGFAAFPGHWGWVVVTAFIVAVGARGRADGVHKGVMRLVGALAGTLGAVALGAVRLPGGPPEAAIIFAVLFVALWLRERNYAYWAAGVTLILALLSGGGDHVSAAFLELRLAAILAGAICAVAALWFVFPIRSEGVIRLRLARALAALDDLVAHGHLPPAETAEKYALYQAGMHEVTTLEAPLRWHSVLFRVPADAEHPARWIAGAVAVQGAIAQLPGDRLLEESDRTALRRAIGLTRRAIGAHGKPETPADALTIGAGLRRVQNLLAKPPG